MKLRGLIMEVGTETLQSSGSKWIINYIMVRSHDKIM